MRGHLREPMAVKLTAFPNSPQTEMGQAVERFERKIGSRTRQGKGFSDFERIFVGR